MDLNWYIMNPWVSLGSNEWRIPSPRMVSHASSLFAVVSYLVDGFRYEHRVEVRGHLFVMRKRPRLATEMLIEQEL